MIRMDPLLLFRCSTFAVVTLAFTPVSQAALLLHWALDESSGTIANDTSGNNIHGTWQATTGAVTWQPSGGIAGGAYAFTGLNRDSFITTSFNAVSSAPFTISLWVKTISTENDGLAYLGNGAAGSEYYVLRMTNGKALVNARNTTEVTGTGVTTINNDSWHHLAAVYASDTDRRLYVDGVLDGSSTTLVNPVTLTRFGIGALTRNTPYNPADLFTGLIDDVQLYSGALSTGDIAFLRANPGSVIPEPSPVAILGLVAGAASLRRRRVSRMAAYS